MKKSYSNKKLIKKNLQEIAKREGISEEKVREEILEAISIALKSDDPNVQTFWRDIPCEGESPTIEETINHIILNLPKK